MKSKMVRDVLIIAVMVLVAVGITVYTKNKGAEKKTTVKATENADKAQQADPHGGMPMGGDGGEQNLFYQWLQVAISQADIKLNEDKPDSEFIAEINGEGIKRADFNKRLELKLAVLTKSDMHGEKVDETALTAEKRLEIEQQVLDQMIEEAFIEAEAKARNVAVSDETFEAAMSSRKEQIGGDEKFQELLSSHGITEAQMRANLRKEMTQQSLAKVVIPEMKKMMGGDMGGGAPHGGMGAPSGDNPHGGMGGGMEGMESPHGGMGAPSGDNPHGGMGTTEKSGTEGEASPHGM